MSVYSKFLSLISGTAKTVDLSKNTLGVQGLQVDGATSGNVTLFASATTSSYSLYLPSSQGAAGTFLQNTGGGDLSWTTIPSSASISNVFIAGQSFTADTSYVVRFGMNALSENADQVYAADYNTSSFDEFWIIGIAFSSTSVSPGQSITVYSFGSYTLGSSDTDFLAADVGTPLWLTSAGGFSTTAPTGDNESDTKIGIVMSTTQIWLDGQMMGIGNVPTGAGPNPLTIAEGGTGVSSFSPYAILAGGSTSTGPMQQVSGLGTSGYVLTSNGPSALPTWQAAGGSALTFTDSLVNTSGTVTLVNDTASPGNTKYYGTNGSGVRGFYSIPATGVSSVALSDGSTAPIYSISGSPVTSSGTLTFTLETQSANAVFAGPSSGSAAQPSFRALVSADIPNNAANTSGTASNITASSNSTLTTLSSLSLPTSQLSGTISLTTQASGTLQAGQFPALTGDVTTTAGSLATTLTTVNSNVGSFGSSTSIPSFTVNAKGLITAASGNAVVAPAGTLSGTTLNSTVTGSSLTSVGTISSGTWAGTTIAIAHGGTGQTTASAAFNALSPITATGDLIVGNGVNSATNLAIGSTGQILTVSGGTAVWAAAPATGVTSVALADHSTTPIYSVSGSPVTSSGTLAITLSNQTANYLFAGPSSGSAAQPTFRSLVSADIPNNAANTSGTAANITATSNSTLTTLPSLSLPASQVSGNISGNAANITATSNSTLTTLSALTTASSLASVGTITSGTWNGSTIAIAHGGTGQTTAAAAYNALSPMTTAGDIEYEVSAGTAARLGIGSTGQVLTVVSGAPAWASPATSGTVTSVALADASTTPIYTITNSPVTSSGTLTLTLNTETANKVFAGPTTGSAAQPTFRSLVSSDIPSLSSIYLPLSGGTMSGAINMGSNQINALATPTLSSDAATKGYVDSAIAGLTWKGPVQAYAASNVPLTGSTPLVIDGYTVQNNDLLLLSAQSTASQDGEYSVAISGGSYTLTANGLPNAIGDAWLVLKGTVYANSSFVATAAVPTATFVEFAGPTAYTFTAPLALTGRTVSISQSNTSTSGYLSSTDWNTFNNKQASGNYITALTGDGTASGPGSAALTLATVNSNVGSFGSSTSIPSFTVNAKGLITAASGNAVIAPAGTLSGTTLNSTVVSSSLTSVGTITTGTWNGTTIAVANGGTGQTTLTNHGLLIGGGSSAITSLAAGATGTILVGQGSLIDPSFSATPALGTSGSVAGTLALANGNTSGAFITLQNLGATTAYNFNLPNSVGSPNQVLTSTGSSSTSMTWTSVASANTASAIVARDSSGNFTAGTITATLSGNASTATTATTATNATNVATTATNSSASTFFPTFVASSSSGNQGVDTATGLTFVPSTNTLTATTFSGALSGNASTATAPASGSAHGNVVLNSSGNFATVAPGTAGNILISNGTDFVSNTITGDVTFPTSSTTAITNNSVANAKLAQMGPTTIKGNNTGSTTNALDLSVTQVLTMLGIKAANQAVGSGVTSVSVTFANSFNYASSTSYSVQATMINTTDTNPQYIPVTITSTSTTGFTASWNSPTPTANYLLSWSTTLLN